MTEISDPVKLANLMCSRLCHDLISPVGAVNSAIELLEDESGSADAEVLTLMSRSASESAAKLAFFRTAFGDGGGASAELSCNRLKILSEGIVPPGKITLHWESGGVDSVRNHAAKLILMFVSLALDALSRGGEITLRIQAMDDGLGVACIAEGPGAGLRDTVADSLSGDGAGVAELSAREITAYYTYLLAMSVGTAVETSSNEGTVTFAVLLP